MEMVYLARLYRGFDIWQKLNPASLLDTMDGTSGCFPRWPQGDRPFVLFSGLSNYDEGGERGIEVV